MRLFLQDLLSNTGKSCKFGPVLQTTIGRVLGLEEDEDKVVQVVGAMVLPVAAAAVLLVWASLCRRSEKQSPVLKQQFKMLRSDDLRNELPVSAHKRCEAQGSRGYLTQWVASLSLG